MAAAPRGAAAAEDRVRKATRHVEKNMAAALNQSRAPDPSSSVTLRGGGLSKRPRISRDRQPSPPPPIKKKHLQFRVVG